MRVNEYNLIIKSFATIIGYLDIVSNIDSYNKVKDKYLYVKATLENWICTFNKNKNFNHITYEESLKIHTILDDLKEEILFDKEIGDEKLISNEILIWYEIIIKKINKER